MSGRDLVDAAARNNAEWCHAFCRTHGVGGRVHATAWHSPVRTPPYYPDAVTLRSGATVGDVIAGIDTGECCSVKDSFACLDFGPAGLRPLLRAEWLARRPDGGGVATAGRWSAVTTDAELRAWEAAWGEAPAGAGFFRPALLADEAVGVLAGYDGDRIVAGAVANRSATVIGLGNVFDTGGDLEAAWAAGAAAAAALWGDLPIVGYDAGDSLDAACGAGFETVGELVVWLRPT